MPVATIDLGALRNNLELLRRRLRESTRFLAAVKANAYGHGALPVARALAESGVDWFGVATPAEAFELRRGGVGADILLLGPAFDQIPQLAEAKVALSVPGPESLDAIRRSGAAEPVRVHLKVDTGMGRLGLGPDAARALAQEIAADGRFALEGLWTHFARADEADRSPTEEQLDEFEGLVEDLARDGIEPPLIHACNSAGLLAYPAAHFDMVRAGISLYGYPPGEALAHLTEGLRPVMSITAPVTFVKRVGLGATVSYGGTWRADRATTVATVRFGYADGYPRLLANRGWAVVGGERAPVAGRICMDQLMLDVGDLYVQPGDRVTLLGPPGPSAAELGDLAQTISYEILTSISGRVERVYTA